MGTNNLSEKSDGTVIPAADHNSLVQALKGDFVPRNSSGVPTADAGDLGSSTYPWERANIRTGYNFCGQVVMVHDFNGDVDVPEGWMKCNGDVVNQTNYDAIHGAGSWAAYIVTSPIENKNLPDANDKFPLGVTNTTQSGSSAITYVGNSGHTINLQHSHTVNSHTHSIPSHNHAIYDYRTGSAHDRYYDSGGNLQDIGGTTKTSPYRHIQIGGGSPDLSNGADMYTSNHSDTSGSASPGTDNQLSTTQSIKPHSFEVEFWIRII